MELVSEKEFATGQNQGLDIQKIRADFPMLQQQVNGKPWIYFDSAATSHKPKVSIDRLAEVYSKEYAKPQEEHTESKASTSQQEQTREKVAKMINAAEPREIIFTKGCTEAINIVAYGFGRGLLKEGDEILISAFEHHANIVPWQFACKLSGATIKVIPITANGELDLDKFKEMLTDKVKIISVLHSSQVLGTILPIRQIADLAHQLGIPVLADGAQMAPHSPVDMQQLDCDFYTFSAHKMGGPAGVGVLYGKAEWLEKLPPFHGGSEMVQQVTFEKSTYQPIPLKFEAGTTPFVDIIAYGVVIDYLLELDLAKTAAYEVELLNYATEKLLAIDQVIIPCIPAEREPVLSFHLKGLQVKELEKYLNDEWNIAVRAGALSAQPLMKILGVEGLLRISFCYYNTREEIDTLVEAVQTFIREKS